MKRYFCFVMLGVCLFIMAPAFAVDLDWRLGAVKNNFFIGELKAIPPPIPPKDIYVSPEDLVSEVGRVYAGEIGVGGVDIENHGDGKLTIYSVTLDSVPDQEYAAYFYSYGAEFKPEEYIEFPVTLDWYESIMSDQTSLDFTTYYKVKPPEEYNLVNVQTERTITIESDDPNRPVINVKVIAEPWAVGFALGAVTDDNGITLLWQIGNYSHLDTVETPRVDIILAVKREGGKYVGVFGRGFKKFKRVKRIARAARVARKLWFVEDKEGEHYLPIPLSDSPKQYRFVAIVVKAGTNKIWEIRQSNVFER